jgi:hypothetical protein
MFTALVLICTLLTPALGGLATAPPVATPAAGFTSASPVSGPSASVPPAPVSSPADDGASIVNSGSTNLAGYEVRVLPNGNLTPGAGGKVRSRLSAALARRFFDDLKAAGPLDALPSGECMKSASFGSATWITYRGKRSPDLSCPGDSAALRAIAADAAAVTNAAGIRPAVRHRAIVAP